MRRSSASRLLLLAMLALGGCEADTATTTATSTPAPPRIPIQQFLPEQPPPPGTADTATGAGADQAPVQARENDPSAPLDTPLCGSAARETIAMDTAISPDVMASAGSCAATACYDPLTDTYLGADGAHHVCQE